MVTANIDEFKRVPGVSVDDWTKADVRGRGTAVTFGCSSTPPWRRPRDPPVTGPLPEAVEIVLGDGIYIAKQDLPPGIVTWLMRLAAFQNPEFYRAQAMRLPTYGTPRIVDYVAYRRDRRKDALLQEHGYLVLRFLAEDLGTRLDAVLDGVLRAFARRTGRRMAGSAS